MRIDLRPLPESLPDLGNLPPLLTRLYAARGVQSAEDALQFIIAGASAVAIGTAGLADPKLPARIVRDLERWCERHGVARVAELIGTLER